MFIEEKRHNSFVRDWQLSMFRLLDASARHDPEYLGFHLVVFENTSPLDGYVKLDGKFASVADLVEFLSLRNSREFYLGMSIFSEGSQ
jgi:hypothetical protein